MSPPPRRYVHLDYPPAPRGPPPRSPPYYYPLGDRGRSPPSGWPSPPRAFGGPHIDRGPFRRDPRDLPPPPGRQVDWERTADMRHHPSLLEPRLHPIHYLDRAPYGVPGRERRLSPPPPQWRPRELPPARSSPRRHDSLQRRPRAASPRRASPAFLDSRLSLRPQRSAAEHSRRDSPGRLAIKREPAERKPEPRDSPSRMATRREPAERKPELRDSPGRLASRTDLGERKPEPRDRPSRLASRREPAGRKPELRDSPGRLAYRRDLAEIKPEPRAVAAQPSSVHVSSSRKAQELGRRPNEDAQGGTGRAEKDGNSRAALGLSEHKAAVGTAVKLTDASGGRSANKEAGAEQAGVPSMAGPARADGSNSEDRTNRGGQPAAQRSPSTIVEADREGASRRESDQESSGRKKVEEADTGTAGQDDKKPRISATAPAPSGRASDAIVDRQPSKGVAATPSKQRPSKEDVHHSHDARKAGSSAAASGEHSGADRREAPRTAAAEQAVDAGPVSPAGTWGRYSATAGDPASAAPSSAAPRDTQPKLPEKKLPDAAAAGKERGRHDPSISTPRDNKPKDGAACSGKGQEGANKNQGKPSAERGCLVPSFRLLSQLKRISRPRCWKMLFFQVDLCYMQARMTEISKEQRASNVCVRSCMKTEGHPGPVRGMLQTLPLSQTARSRTRPRRAPTSQQMATAMQLTGKHCNMGCLVFAISKVVCFSGVTCLVNWFVCLNGSFKFVQGWGTCWRYEHGKG